LDNVGSNVFGYKRPEVNGLAQTLTDGVAVPAILLSNMPANYKLALAGTALLSGRVANFLGAESPSSTMSTFFRPNAVDTVGMTVAALSGLDGRSKAMLIGGAYLAGRAYNEIAHVTGFDKDPSEMRDNSLRAVAIDGNKRSTTSFAEAVESAKTLGKENEVALELQMKDWMSKSADSISPIANDRGKAAIAEALGEFRLEEGTRLDLTTHQDTEPRILKGFNYDFGGEATTWLRWSAGSLVNAENFVDAHKGETVDKQVMNDEYRQQLKDLQTKVESKLDIVYGAHDINGIFNELKDQKNFPQLYSDLLRMRSNLEVSNSQDAQNVAKQNRDLALGYLVVAASNASERHDDNESAIMYKAALQYLQKSEMLVGKDQADNRSLEKLQTEVAKGIPEIVNTAIKNYSDTLNNK
jgi:hypothetical protein